MVKTASRERYTKTGHKTFCIGVSLGAHVCGFMGTSGNELLGDGTKALDRIIALDPAGMYSAHCSKGGAKIKSNVFKL